MNPLDAVVRKLHSIEGVIDVWHVEDPDRRMILELEESANQDAGLAIGIEIANTGATLALQKEYVVCINHSPTLRHPPGPILTLGADEGILGEEVWEETKIAKLRSDPNIMFLGNGFVLFKDKMKKTKQRRLRFEYGPQSFPEIETIHEVCDVVSATISPAADVYVKKKAKWPRGDPETGTVLIGFNPA